MMGVVVGRRAVGVLVAVLVLAGVVVSGGAVGAQDPGPSEALSGAEANEGGPGFVAAQSRVALGGGHSCALLDDGTVRCWGRNFYGQLGSTTNNSTLNANPVPEPAVDLGGHAAVAVTAGDIHSCALLDDGTVRCWGNNNSGQLGSATNDGTSTPNPVPLSAVDLGGHAAVAVTAGDDHSCALLDDGTVRCWGYNVYGQLGSTPIGAVNPVPLSAVDLGGHAAVAVTAGDNHSCALLDDGTVRCWGLNFYGQLGSTANNITLNAHPVPEPAVDLGGRAAVAVTASDSYSCALLDDGTVRCWGYNNYGQLGSATNSGTGTANPVPLSVVDLGGHAAVAVTAGNTHSCALLDDGTVRCWGNNYFGQLGSTTNNGTGTPNPVPEPAVGLPAIVLPPPPPPTGLVVAAITSPDEADVLRVSWTTPASSPPDPIVSYTVAAGGQSEVVAAAGGEVAAAATKSATLTGVDRSVAQTVTVTATTKFAQTSTASVTAPALRSRIYVANRIASGPADYDFLFAPPGAPVVTGDWNGDGHTGFASRVGNVFTLVDQNGNPQGTAGYGKPTDEIYIGDWNGNGQDTFGVRRGNIFYLRNTPTSGNADIVLGYGKAGDEVFVGDWDGDGEDTFAVRRGNTFYVRNSVTSGPADVVFGYGKAGDEVIVGDWNQDGIDTFAVRRGNIIFIRNNFQSGPAEQTIGYGKAGDTLLVGDYNADGSDTFAVRRLEPTP